MRKPLGFYSHVNYSVTKITSERIFVFLAFYSHVNYSVTKIGVGFTLSFLFFYSHVNYSVTKIVCLVRYRIEAFTVT